jgi:hypothetical protein
MPSRHKKEATRILRRRYGEAWSVKIIPVGVELQRELLPDLAQHVFFNFVRDDMLGLRVQPALGVKFAAVNAARDAISPRHQYTVDPVTGFVFLNDLIEIERRQSGGWLFEADKPIQPAFDHFLDFVDETICRVGFFESLQTVEDYIAAVEAGRWAFITVAPLYLYALIAVGKINKAKELAAHHRAQQVKAANERGLVLREADMQPYDEILKIPS